MVTLPTEKHQEPDKHINMISTMPPRATWKNIAMVIGKLNFQVSQMFFQDGLTTTSGWWQDAISSCFQHHWVAKCGRQWLVGGLEHDFYFSIYREFHHLRLSYSSEGLTQPTRWDLIRATQCHSGSTFVYDMDPDGADANYISLIHLIMILILYMYIYIY